MIRSIGLALLPCSILALASAGCTKSEGGGLEGTVRIDGSSTVAPISMSVAEVFDDENPARVTVGVSGTGGGFKRFLKGETDISNASRPIQPEEYRDAKENGIEFIEIPVAYDGLSIVVNKENTWCKMLTVEDLKTIFLEDRAAQSWKDVREEFPDVPLKIFAPGTDSGTFDYFKEVVAGKTGSIRPDMSVSEDDNVVVNGVVGNKGAIGFFGCSYYFQYQDQLNIVAIDGGDGPVVPSPSTIVEGTYAPFSRPLFIYVKKASLDRPEVKAFVEFYLKEGPDIAERVGYVKLPEEIYTRARANFENRRTGSVYIGPDGEKVRGSLTEVYL